MRRHLHAVLDDIAAELAELASSAESLQANLARSPPLVGANGIGRPSVRSKGTEPDGSRRGLIIALQSLDHMTQSLQCLAQFVSGTARQVAPECQADLAEALDSVFLSTLKGRLGALPRDRMAPGELELFDAA